MFGSIREDIASVFDRDPAAKSVLEVLLCYSGLHALWFHRFNHWLWNHHAPAGPLAFAGGAAADGNRDSSGARKSAGACSSITAWASSSGKPA